MRLNDAAGSQDRARTSAEDDLKEIVMGLHWDPPQEGASTEPGNLDALCLLLDTRGRVLELVHPGKPRNANGSVLHTGDSPAGASEWDDERIFVFLEALPETVSGLAFVVVSANGHAFGEVPGASCHVSDRLTEHEWVRVDLTALGPCTAHCAATLRRDLDSWRIFPGSQAMNPEALADILASAACENRGHGFASAAPARRPRP